MEPQNSGVEDLVFINASETRKVRPASEPMSPLAATDEMVSEVSGEGGDTQATIGLAKVL